METTETHSDTELQPQQAQGGKCSSVTHKTRPLSRVRYVVRGLSTEIRTFVADSKIKSPIKKKKLLLLFIIIIIVVVSALM